MRGNVENKIKTTKADPREEFEIKLDKNGKVIFSELDFEGLKRRFNLTKLTCVGNVLFISTSMDEYYVEYVGGKLVLFHKNAFKNTKGYHRENRDFENIFNVLGYCKHHYNKHKGIGHNSSYKMSRMEKLFAKIQTQSV